MPPTSSARPRTLAAAVFVTDPETRESLLLAPGTTVTDPVLADQITHPDAWAPGPGPAPPDAPVQGGASMTALTDAEYAYL